MRARIAVVVLLLLASLVCQVAAQRDDGKTQSSQASEAAKPAAGAAKSRTAERDGAKLFQAHCNRCHTAPDELSPRVARTVVLHMRVRGMLPEKDVHAILDYIAPE